MQIVNSCHGGMAAAGPGKTTMESTARLYRETREKVPGKKVRLH